MAWSTSRLADLAGTTLRAVRHYHDVGLLDLPERRANGYKSYGVVHLVRVLRIRRLTNLGLSLTQIADLGDAQNHPDEVLRSLDDELAATIERLRLARAELAGILRGNSPTDLPPDVAAAVAGAGLSPQERALVAVLAQLLDPDVVTAYANAMAEFPKSPAEFEFDVLPADAPEHVRRVLADRLRELPATRKARAAFPDVASMCADAPRDERFVLRTVGEVMVELYNPAQLDVLVRVGS
ncbi:MULTISPECIES: MerR family transcriptional regulator [Actinosynnema]|uniref:MerR family transcriptional regulator n=1 Tax=Actinosynnema TaxID=40566 RepID=UPI0020A52455|nr:MerR family transcriptional regulator [Actinosynnema pretiosum]MCP2096655.1 DNA-binding transcriptional regulator, MerR family [Actinosynnema pretiosum]